MILYTQSNTPIRTGEWNTPEIDLIKLKLPGLITCKPLVYLVNMTEADFISKKNRFSHQLILITRMLLPLYLLPTTYYLLPTTYYLETTTYLLLLLILIPILHIIIIILIKPNTILQILLMEITILIIILLLYYY